MARRFPYWMKEKGKLRGTKRSREAAFKMSVPDFEIPFTLIYPDHNQSVKAQIEPVLYCMLVYGEARGEIDEGIEAVADVVMNRFNSQRSYFGYSIRDVILDRNTNGVWEFSVMNPSDVNYKKMLEPDLPAWLRVCKIVLPIYFHRMTNLPDNVLFYTTLDNMYFDDNPLVEEHCRIGNHKFFRETL